MTAARALQFYGFDVTVVEAKDRVGGRCWTEEVVKGCKVDLGSRQIQGVIGNAVADMCFSRYVPLLPCSKPGTVPLYDEWGMIFSNKNRSIRTVNVRKEMDFLSEKLSRTAYKEVLLEDACKKAVDAKCEFLSWHHKQPPSALKPPPQPSTEQLEREKQLLSLAASGNYVGRELVRQISLALKARFDDVDDVALTLENMVDSIDLLGRAETPERWREALQYKSIGEVIDEYIAKDTPFLDR